jgi:hypothetical protein
LTPGRDGGVHVIAIVSNPRPAYGLLMFRGGIATGGGLIALATAVVALAIAATTAQAETTRAAWVAQVDPICHTEHGQAKAVYRSYKNQIRPFVKRGIDPEHLPKAAVRIYVRYQDKVVRIRGSADTQISTVPPASGDEGTVSQWLRLRGVATGFIKRSTRVLSHGNSERAGKLLTKTYDREFKAEILVQDFGFNYCTPFLTND